MFKYARPDEPPNVTALRSLFEKLTAFKVKRWAMSSSSDDLERDREVTDLENADVISSLIKGTEHLSGGVHVLAIDIDLPCYLVKSTTPGHYHFYVNAAITWKDYTALLRALSDAGIIEEGYVQASLARGHTDLRLPWVKKQQPVA